VLRCIGHTDKTAGHLLQLSPREFSPGTSQCALQQDWFKALRKAEAPIKMEFAARSRND
jgi:hypothetical protein